MEVISATRFMFSTASLNETCFGNSARDFSVETAKSGMQTTNLGVAGMMFEAGDNLEQFPVGERAAVEFVEGEDDAEPDGHAGAESASGGHLALDFDLRAVGFDFAAPEKRVHRLAGHRQRGGIAA